MQSSATASSKPGFSLSLTSLAPVIFVLLWSTGFVGAKYGLPYAEPFTYLSIRFALAIVLLFGIGLATRARWPHRRIDAIHIAISGLLLHGIYLNGVFQAINMGVPAGMTSLIVSLQPVLTAIFAQILLRERVSARMWFGLMLGLVGVGLVIGEKLVMTGAAGQSFPPAALLPAFLALLGTTFGTIYQKRYCADMNIATGTIIQYLAGGSITILAALLFETRVVQWTAPFIFAMSWQVLVLSIGAISLMMYLIRQNSTSRMSSLFYLVPPLAALEAYLLFNEQLGLVALVGMALVVVGVVMVMRAPRRENA